MYRNCVFDNKTRAIHLWCWDEKGNRVYQELPYKPYLYLEHKDGEDRSIYGTSIRKREFNTLWDRNKFVKESGIKRIFENLPPYQQFLIDNYYHCCGDESFSENPLKIMVLDIECPGLGSFPDPEFAENIINLLTCYDSISKKYNVFGLKPYTPKDKSVKYTHCKSEEELLVKFIRFFSSDYPDCLIGWASAGFDIPYLVNRINKVLGEGCANELSPMGRIYEKISKDGKFGQPLKTYVIQGISSLDYMVLYKKFALEPLESYRLDYVAEVELDEHKVDFDGSLWDLSVNDWDKFVEYNVKDCEIIVKLDDELKYIDLIRFIAYLGLCDMERAVATLPVINGAVAIQARHRGEKIPTFIRAYKAGKIPGGYVAEPKLGFSESLVSFDANSLYPNIMISLNISPETKIGRVEKVGDMYNIHHVSGRTFELTKENYVKFLREEKASITKANILFSQKKMGLMPEFLDFLYTKRKEMKSNMFLAKKDYESRKGKLTKSEQNRCLTDIKKYNTYQNAYKITLNSTYGYCANKYAPLGDDDIGTSVTLTGQAVIKKSNCLFLDFLTKNYPDLSEEKSHNSLIYNDTDSCHLSLKCLEEFGVVLKDGNKISQDFYKLCDKVEDYINSEMRVWANTKFLSQDPRLEFKRESICDVGMFASGKNYVLHIMDDEGMPVDKFKYKGISVVKTTMPKTLKPYVKEIIETMALTRSVKDTNEAFLKSYEIFKGLGVDSIYKNNGVNNYEKYVKNCSGLNTVKAMPGHAKAAYYHDWVLEQIKASDKYEKFKSGDKVKQVYLKTPNKFGIDIIGFKGKYPTEFENIFKIDYDRMFNKLLFSAIETLYKVVGWKLRKPNENVKIELEYFLS